MEDVQLGRALRALRHRRGWRQQDLAAASQVARSVLADLEAGRFDGHAIGALRRVAREAGAWIRIDLVVAGSDVRRLLDADHANLQALWKSRLEQHGWEVSAEATFNHFGERGSIDLLAWHAATSTLLVIEIKTVVVDVQDLLAGVDRKVRIGDVVARKRGWSPRAVVPGLMVAEGTSVRRRITDHASLFAPFSLRGRSAVAWLADPVGPAPSGILCLTKLPNARPGDRRRAGRQRIRLRRAK